MGFWKNLFSSSESASVPQTADFEEDVAVGLGDPLSPTFRKPASGNARIFFSCDRDIDLYELEELCDAVGWSRRPLRKVKKAIQHSFLVVSMWEHARNPAPSYRLSPERPQTMRLMPRSGMW